MTGSCYPCGLWPSTDNRDKGSNWPRRAGHRRRASFAEARILMYHACGTQGTKSLWIPLVSKQTGGSQPSARTAPTATPPRLCLPTNAMVGIATIAQSWCADWIARPARQCRRFTSRRCAGQRSPIGAGARVRPAARPSGRACRVTRADQMAIVTLSRLGLDHVVDAALRVHEVVDVAPPGHRPPRRTFRARRPVPSVRGGWRSGSPALRLWRREPRSAFRLRGNRPWPHCGPTEHPDRADPPTARS